MRKLGYAELVVAVALLTSHVYASVVAYVVTKQLLGACKDIHGSVVPVAPLKILGSISMLPLQQRIFWVVVVVHKTGCCSIYQREKKKKKTESLTHNQSMFLYCRPPQHNKRNLSTSYHRCC